MDSGAPGGAKDAGGPQKSQHFGRKLDAERHLDIIRATSPAVCMSIPKKGRVTFKAFAEEWRVSSHTDRARRPASNRTSGCTSTPRSGTDP